MVEFLKKAMDWVLEKEDEAAKNCKINPEDIDKQINIIKEKREELKKKCQEEDAEFGHILARLTAIKADTNSCKDS